MNKFFRNTKNKVVTNRKGLNLFLALINTPIIGNAYDFFYLNRIKNKVKKSPIEVTIEPNNICNLQCIMCSYKDMKRKKETMSMDLFRKIVDEASELGCKEIHLTQYNEPLTDKNIFDRLAYIRQKGLKSSFYSNATLLNDQNIKKILQNPPDLVRFSVDGTDKKTFESIRKGANFEKVVNNIKKLYQERQKNKQSLPVIEVFFTIFDMNRKEAENFGKEWAKYCDFASLYPADSRKSDEFVPVNYQKRKSYPCFNPRKVIVLSSGKVALCCVDVDGAFNLGDLNKSSLKEILDSKAYNQIFKSQVDRSCGIKMCQNCSKGCVDSAFQWWFY